MPFSHVVKEDTSKRKPSERDSQRPGKLPPRNRSEAYPRVSACTDVRIVAAGAATCVWIPPFCKEDCTLLSRFCPTTACCVVGGGVDNLPWRGWVDLSLDQEKLDLERM